MVLREIFSLLKTFICSIESVVSKEQKTPSNLSRKVPRSNKTRFLMWVDYFGWWCFGKGGRGGDLTLQKKVNFEKIVCPTAFPETFLCLKFSFASFLKISSGIAKYLWTYCTLLGLVDIKYFGHFYAPHRWNFVVILPQNLLFLQKNTDFPTSVGNFLSIFWNLYIAKKENWIEF